MAQNKLIGSKVSKFYDRNAIPGVKFDSATQLGIVKDNLAPARDGRLRVWIPDFGGNENDSQMWRTVSYASPYAGTTYQPQTSLNNNFTGVNHSYGMFMAPPDIGNLVLCTFVNGDPERGFWFACVPGVLSTWMIPGIAAGNKVDTSSVSPDLQRSVLPSTAFPPQYLPVVEFNENIDGTINDTFYNNAKPIHEYQANILFQQGLDRDKVRGAISSTSQRETPSHVFGISTPGRPLGKDPADDPNYAARVNSGDITNDQYAIPTRKGGHTFVMDDGDTTGTDQLIRLRTAGGHQILMNDDQSTMYIAHKDGTTWLEIDTTGVKLYTAGDLSFRTEGNLNLHSDNDINIEALGNIRMDSMAATTITSPIIAIGGIESTLIYGAKTNIGGGQLTVSSDGTLNVSSGGGMSITGGGIDIDGGGGGNSITCPVINKNKLADTSFDSQKTGLWYSVPQAVDSVVNILPSHEPWLRVGTPAKTIKEVATTTCTPKMGSNVTDYTLPPANGNKLDNGKIKGAPAPWTTDTAFISAVQATAAALNLNYIDMLACMHLETGGTMDPAITNSLGYTGLIQFGGPAATACGTTTAALREMDRPTQCTYVTKYFQANRLNQKAPNPRLVDIYLTILWPAAVGKPENFVIWAGGSAQYNANPAFDKSLPNPTGSVTVQSVENIIMQHEAAVKQALANAGVAQPNNLTSSNGSTVTDGSGNPVKTGTTSNSTASDNDVGITNAAGQQVSGSTCPAEFLSKSTTYNPPGGIGNANPRLTQQQAKAMLAELGYFESQFNYSAIMDARIGKYQVDAEYLAAAGFIKPDAITQFGGNVLTNDESWTNNENIQSQDDFFTNQNVQDVTQYNEFVSNYELLVANGGILPDDDICTAAGMLFVAHQFRDADKATEWRHKGDLTDALGQNGTVYFNQGRYAIDVLAAGGAGPVQQLGVKDTSSIPVVGPTGIDPDSVFTFQSSGSGTRANFDHLNSSFRNALLTMAQDFKTKAGAKINITSAYRSPADQEAVYQKWLAAGGGPGRPTAGGITTPAKPASLGGKGSPHNNGVAIDSSQCPSISRTVDLAQYGLRWGGTFSTPDAVHIQEANASQ